MTRPRLVLTAASASSCSYSCCIVAQILDVWYSDFSDMLQNKKSRLQLSSRRTPRALCAGISVVVHNIRLQHVERPVVPEAVNSVSGECR